MMNAAAHTIGGSKPPVPTSIPHRVVHHDPNEPPHRIVTPRSRPSTPQSHPNSRTSSQLSSRRSSLSQDEMPPQRYKQQQQRQYHQQSDVRSSSSSRLAPQRRPPPVPQWQQQQQEDVAARVERENREKSQRVRAVLSQLRLVGVLPKKAAAASSSQGEAQEQSAVNLAAGESRELGKHDLHILQCVVNTHVPWRNSATTSTTTHQQRQRQHSTGDGSESGALQQLLQERKRKATQQQQQQHGAAAMQGPGYEEEEESEHDEALKSAAKFMEFQAKPLFAGIVDVVFLCGASTSNRSAGTGISRKRMDSSNGRGDGTASISASRCTSTRSSTHPHQQRQQRQDQRRRVFMAVYPRWIAFHNLDLVHSSCSSSSSQGGEVKNNKEQSLSVRAHKTPTQLVYVHPNANVHVATAELTSAHLSRTHGVDINDHSADLLRSSKTALSVYFDTGRPNPLAGQLGLMLKKKDGGSGVASCWIEAAAAMACLYEDVECASMNQQQQQLHGSGSGGAAQRRHEHLVRGLDAGGALDATATAVLSTPSRDSRNISSVSDIDTSTTSAAAAVRGIHIDCGGDEAKLRSLFVALVSIVPQPLVLSALCPMLLPVTSASVDPEARALVSGLLAAHAVVPLRSAAFHVERSHRNDAAARATSNGNVDENSGLIVDDSPRVSFPWTRHRDHKAPLKAHSLPPDAFVDQLADVYGDVRRIISVAQFERMLFAVSAVSGGEAPSSASSNSKRVREERKRQQQRRCASTVSVLSDAALSALDASRHAFGTCVHAVRRDTNTLHLLECVPCDHAAVTIPPSLLVDRLTRHPFIQRVYGVHVDRRSGSIVLAFAPCPEAASSSSSSAAAAIATTAPFHRMTLDELFFAAKQHRHHLSTRGGGSSASGSSACRFQLTRRSHGLRVIAAQLLLATCFVHRHNGCVGCMNPRRVILRPCDETATSMPPLLSSFKRPHKWQCEITQIGIGTVHWSHALLRDDTLPYVSPRYLAKHLGKVASALQRGAKFLTDTNIGRSTARQEAESSVYAEWAGHEGDNSDDEGGEDIANDVSGGAAALWTIYDDMFSIGALLFHLYFGRTVLDVAAAGTQGGEETSPPTAATNHHQDNHHQSTHQHPTPSPSSASLISTAVSVATALAPAPAMTRVPDDVAHRQSVDAATSFYSRIIRQAAAAAGSAALTEQFKEEMCELVFLLLTAPWRCPQHQHQQQQRHSSRSHKGIEKKESHSLHAEKLAADIFSATLLGTMELAKVFSCADALLLDAASPMMPGANNTSSNTAAATELSNAPQFLDFLKQGMGSSCSPQRAHSRDQHQQQQLRAAAGQKASNPLAPYISHQLRACAERELASRRALLGDDTRFLAMGGCMLGADLPPQQTQELVVAASGRDMRVDRMVALGKMNSLRIHKRLKEEGRKMTDTSPQRLIEGPSQDAVLAIEDAARRPHQEQQQPEREKKKAVLSAQELITIERQRLHFPVNPKYANVNSRFKTATQAMLRASRIQSSPEQSRTRSSSRSSGNSSADDTTAANQRQQRQQRQREEGIEKDGEQRSALKQRCRSAITKKSSGNGDSVDESHRSERGGGGAQNPDRRVIFDDGCQSRAALPRSFARERVKRGGRQAACSASHRTPSPSPPGVQRNVRAPPNRHQAASPIERSYEDISALSPMTEAEGDHQHPDEAAASPSPQRGSSSGEAALRPKPLFPGKKIPPNKIKTPASQRSEEHPQELEHSVDDVDKPALRPHKTSPIPAPKPKLPNRQQPHQQRQHEDGGERVKMPPPRPHRANNPDEKIKQDQEQEMRDEEDEFHSIPDSEEDDVVEEPAVRPHKASPIPVPKPKLPNRQQPHQQRQHEDGGERVKMPPPRPHRANNPDEKIKQDQEQEMRDEEDEFHSIPDSEEDDVVEEPAVRPHKASPIPVPKPKLPNRQQPHQQRQHEDGGERVKMPPPRPHRANNPDEKIKQDQEQEMPDEEDEFHSIPDSGEDDDVEVGRSASTHVNNAHPSLRQLPSGHSQLSDDDGFHSALDGT